MESQQWYHSLTNIYVPGEACSGNWAQILQVALFYTERQQRGTLPDIQDTRISLTFPSLKMRLNPVGRFFFLHFFFVCFGHAHSMWKMWKFPSQELNLRHSSNLGCCSDNAGSLTWCTTRELPFGSFETEMQSSGPWGKHKAPVTQVLSTPEECLNIQWGWCWAHCCLPWPSCTHSAQDSPKQTCHFVF